MHREARMRPKPYEYHPQLGAGQPAYAQTYRFPAPPSSRGQQTSTPPFILQEGENLIISPALIGSPARSSSAGSSSYLSQATATTSIYSSPYQQASAPTGGHQAPTTTPQPQRFTRMDQLALQAMRAAEHEHRQAEAAAQAYRDWITRSRSDQSRFWAEGDCAPEAVHQ